ncbi:MAG: hypothetical protein PHE53_08895 [Thermoguttaceae bacterium]|nr:hypothetical protein [Thermoguttaceae bacterium]
MDSLIRRNDPDSPEDSDPICRANVSDVPEALKLRDEPQESLICGRLRVMSKFGGLTLRHMRWGGV